MSKQSAMQAAKRPFASYAARHFKFEPSADGRVASIRLNRPERKNPLTFDSYAELRDLFRDLVYASDVRAVVLTGSGGNFCSGGDVFEIIEPLTKMRMHDLLAFTRMTGDLVRAMRKCPQQIVAAVDGVCAGAGAILAMASDLRLATGEAKTGVLVHASRPRRGGYGRVRNFAAHHWPGPGGGTLGHWPCDDRAGRPCLGVLQ
jgi:1,4-dihydroxy-2-naphthoyl-CoA synthase